MWRPDHLTFFIPMLGMLMMLAVNLAVSQRRDSHRTGRDARRLRAALLAELTLLRDLIADNLALMRRGEEYLLSFRVLTHVYRSNAGRLNLLPESEIDAVVCAYGSTEAAELFVGAATKPHGQHAYRAWLGDTAWVDISRRLQTAHAAVEQAIGHLEQARLPASRYFPPIAPMDKKAPPDLLLDS
jgi:hypothetical protein